MVWSNFSGDNADWDSVVQQLNATSPFATSGWAEFKEHSRWTVLRGVRKENERVSSAVQIFWVNILGLFTIAWIPGGVLGSFNGSSSDLLSFISSISGKKFVYCRISFHIADDNLLSSTLSQNGWRRAHRFIGAQDTFILARTKNSLADRSSLSSNWRRNLERGLKRNQHTSVWSNPNPLELHQLFQQMIEFKQEAGLGIAPSPESLNSLIDSMRERLTIVQTRDQFGQLIAIRGAFRVGDFAWDALAASNETARKNYSSYVCAWHLIETLDNLGIQEFDLAGVDPERNVGVFNFKKGFGGSSIRYLGEWDAARGAPIRQVAGALISRLA
jgi:hypothetical protein